MPEKYLIILDGSAFFCGDQNGDVEAQGPTGFFYEDVRHLSTWLLTVDGEPVKPLTSTKVDYFSARVVGTPKKDRNAVSVRRDRFVTDGFHEDVVITNLEHKRRKVAVELEFASDFADVMEAQKKGTNEVGRTRVELGTRTANLRHDRNGYRRGTTITFSRTPKLTRNRASFKLDLAPGEEWNLCVDVVPVIQGTRRPALLRCASFGANVPKMEISVAEWLEQTPDLVTGSLALSEVYRTSIMDLAALRLRPDENVKWALPGGGLPWFMTLFGRDSLIASYQALPFHSTLARATLLTLADLQATAWDNYRDAEPGKIPHELRRGILASIGATPQSPYYGTHDATLLFLILLDEYERWTGDADLVRGLEDHARAASSWLEGPADLDADGWLEYRCRSKGQGSLENQGWKDSDNAILFADGRRAEPPIALCEVQGYAYDARLRAARLAREFWDDEELAQSLESGAEEMRKRFDEVFWIRSRGHYALALDGKKQQVDSLTSNVGHLLWSGIVSDRRARQIVQRLMREDMYSGWGIRSMSAKDHGYNPLEYHNGTVWPHDTAIIAEGMRRYGFRDEASALAHSLLKAAARFENQLP
jgi:glycogen debranching enzyme